MSAPPDLEVLRFVYECRPEHAGLLYKIEESFWDGTTALDLLLRRNEGRYSFFETPNGGALVITEVASSPAGLELFIVGVAGEGILSVAPAMISDLRAIARAFGCKFIGGLGIPAGWERPALAFGFRKAATYYLMELSNGQG